MSDTNHTTNVTSANSANKLAIAASQSTPSVTADWELGLLRM